MIHDAEVEVSCDNYENCTSNVYLPCTWYVHGYRLDDSEAEQKLINDHGWIVEDGKHYCSEKCKEQHSMEKDDD